MGYAEQGWRMEVPEASRRRKAAAEGEGVGRAVSEGEGRRGREGSREETLFQVLVEGDEPIGVSVQKCLRTGVAKVSR